MAKTPDSTADGATDSAAASCGTAAMERATLLSPDECWYCTGLTKTSKKNRAELIAARENKFKVGSTFFVEQKTQYVNKPFKPAIDLPNITFASWYGMRRAQPGSEIGKLT